MIHHSRSRAAALAALAALPSGCAARTAVGPAAAHASVRRHEASASVSVEIRAPLATVFDYVVRAVALVADHGHKLAPHYCFDPMTGLWQHRAGPVEPPLRLASLSYDADGVLTYPRQHDTAPESALRGYLSEAVALFESLPEVVCEEGVGDQVSADFEQLRWFDLPAECLEPASRTS